MIRKIHFVPCILVAAGFALNPVAAFSQSGSSPVEPAPAVQTEKATSPLPVSFTRLDAMMIQKGEGEITWKEPKPEYSDEQCLAGVEAFLQDNLADVTDQEALAKMWLYVGNVLRIRSLKVRAELVVRHLKAKDPTIQGQVLHVLSYSDSAPFQKEIAELLESPHQSVKQGALMALVRIGSRAVIPLLIQQLTDPDKSNRASAVHGLIVLNEKAALPKIVPLFADPDWIVRRLAVEGVVKLDGKTYVKELWKLVDGTPDGSFNGRALVALASYGEPRAIQMVMNQLLSLNSQDVKVLGPAHEVRELIKVMKPRAMAPTLIRTLKSDHLLGKDECQDIEIRRSFIRLLIEWDARAAIPLFRKWIQSSQHPLKVDAAFALGRLKAHEAFDDLVALVKSESKLVIEESKGGNYCPGSVAATALSQLGDRRAVPVLLEYLPTVESPFYCVQAIKCLNRLLEPELFRKVETIKVKVDPLYLPLNQAVAALNRNGEIPIVLSMQSADWKNPKYTYHEEWPKVGFVAHEVSLEHALDNIVSELGRFKRSAYVVDAGTIRIMAYEDAKQWMVRKIGQP